MVELARHCLAWLGLLVTWAGVTASTTSTVLVESPFGPIQGLKTSDPTTGESYVTFKGIPYAKPPLGHLRFAKPQPHPKLAGVFDATKDDIIRCHYPHLMTFGQTGFMEDCLVLSIYAKDLDPRGQSWKKVMVFVHGGGFSVGSGYSYEPKSFVTSQDVIVVTINYRLGVLGFLSTENEASPGNYGLWDQLLALRWVKDNIRAFGGDPDDVTLAGESAGAASVGFQMISPHAKDVFAKVYVHSGSATSIFTLSRQAQADALVVARSAGCWEDTDQNLSVEESTNLVECLRKAPVSALTSYDDFFADKTPFVPRVDGDFIPDAPATLLGDDVYLESLKFFDRPYLIGMNNFEYGYGQSVLRNAERAIHSDDQTSTEEKDSEWKKLKAGVKQFFLASRLGKGGASDESVVAAVEDFYVRRFADDETALLEMMADLNFLIAPLDMARAVSQRPSGSAYLLYFNHFPTFLKGSLRGTSHGVELAFWLDLDLRVVDRAYGMGIVGGLGEEDVAVKRLFSSVIAHFMRFGDPGTALKDRLPCGWPKYDVKRGQYLSFSINPWVSNFLKKDKQDLWFTAVSRTSSRRHVHSEL